MKEIHQRVSVDPSETMARIRYLERGGGDAEWIVTVDGNEVKRVITADPQLGYVVAYKTDDNDNLLVDKERKEVLTHRIDGSVAVRCVA